MANLKKANEQFRIKNYKSAIEYYHEFINEFPRYAKCVQANIIIAEERIKLDKVYEGYQQWPSNDYLEETLIKNEKHDESSIQKLLSTYPSSTYINDKLYNHIIKTGNYAYVYENYCTKPLFWTQNGNRNKYINYILMKLFNLSQKWTARYLIYQCQKNEVGFFGLQFLYRKSDDL